MVWFEWWRLRHTILFVTSVMFLLSYFGLVTWGQVEHALGRLADQPEALARFDGAMGRAEALITAFLFLFLTPLAIAMAGGVLAFVAAIVGGVLRGLTRLHALPDWVFALAGYAVIVGTAWYWSEEWLPLGRAFIGLIAQAILVAAA